MSLTDEKELNNRFDTVVNWYNRYNYRLGVNRKFLDDRRRDQWYDDQRGSYLGASLGIDRLPSNLDYNLNYGFEDYVVAPLASAIEAFDYESMAKDVPSAITVNDGIKMSKTNKNQNGKGKTMPKKLFSGKPPAGMERFDRKHNRREIMGRDGRWHPKYKKLRGRIYKFNINSGGYSTPAPRRDFTGPRRGRNPQSQTAPAYPKLNRNNPRGPPSFGRMETQSGLRIGAASFRGDNHSIQKRPKFVGDDMETVDVKVYLGKIGYTTAQKITWTPYSSTGTDTGGQYYFNPTLAPYISSTSGAIIYNSAQRFRRYRVLGGVMEFTPLVSAYSNPDIRVAALLTRQVDWFAAMKGTSANFVGSPATPTAQDTPTRQVLLSNSKACAGPGWAEKGFICPIPPTGWLYSTSPDNPGTPTDVVDFTNSWAAYRQSLAFVLGLNIEGTVGGGTLYILECTMTIKLRFKEQGPNGVYGLSVDHPEQRLINSVKKLDRILAFLQLDEKDEKKRYVPDELLKRGDSRTSLRSESIDDHKAISTRKSGSTKSNPEAVVHRRFDSTLGYPGEGPIADDKSNEDDEWVEVCAFCRMICCNCSLGCSQNPFLLKTTVFIDKGVVKLDDTTQDFDSTLGFPGEGPYRVKLRDYNLFLFELGLANLTYYRTRKEFHARFTHLIRAGGDFEIDEKMARTVLNGLVVPPPRFDNNASLALQTAIESLSSAVSEVVLLQKESKLNEPTQITSHVFEEEQEPPKGSKG